MPTRTKQRQAFASTKGFFVTLKNLSQDYSARINSLDFHRSADLLVTAADDDSIKLYGLETGTPYKLLHSKKYGISQVNFTHHPSAIIFASNKVSPGAEPCTP